MKIEANYPDPTTQVRPRDLVLIATGPDSNGRADYSSVAVIVEAELFPDEVCVTFEQGASVWVERSLLRPPF